MNRKNIEKIWQPIIITTTNPNNNKKFLTNLCAILILVTNNLGVSLRVGLLLLAFLKVFEPLKIAQTRRSIPNASGSRIKTQSSEFMSWLEYTYTEFNFMIKSINYFILYVIHYLISYFIEFDGFIVLIYLLLYRSEIKPNRFQKPVRYVYS